MVLVKVGSSLAYYYSEVYNMNYNLTRAYESLKDWKSACLRPCFARMISIPACHWEVTANFISPLKLHEHLQREHLHCEMSNEKRCPALVRDCPSMHCRSKRLLASKYHHREAFHCRRRQGRARATYLFRKSGRCCSQYPCHRDSCRAFPSCPGFQW